MVGGAGWARCTSPLRRRKCGDTSVSPAPPCRTYFLVGSNPPFNPNKKTTREGWLFYWLGWQDSNLRMSAPKADALPLGDTPIRFFAFGKAICKIKIFYLQELFCYFLHILMQKYNLISLLPISNHLFYCLVTILKKIKKCFNVASFL